MDIQSNSGELNNFRNNIYHLMNQLPVDKITTYGDLASMCGRPGWARRVGSIAHGGPMHLPWHRLVKSSGQLAEGFPGGAEAQRQLLQADGIACKESSYRIAEFERRRWRGPEVDVDDER